MPTIRVKKPFEPDPSASPKPTLPVAMQETNAVEINPEFEEKPVVDSVSKTSEEYHGGSELSFSMPDTSVSSPIPMPSESSNSSSSSSSSDQFESTSPSSSETPKTEQQSSGQSQPESSSQQSSEERPESSSLSSQTSTSTTESPNQQSEQQSIASSSSESPDQQQLKSTNSFSEQHSQAPEATKTSSIEQSSQMPEVSEQTSESSASTATEQQLGSGSSEESTTEASAQESSESSVSSEQPSTNSSVATESAEQSNAQQGTELQANEQTNAEEEGEEDKEEEEDEEIDDEEEEEDEDQAYSYTFNTQQAFDVTDTDYVDVATKYYQTEFYRFIEMIAEEKTKFYDPYNAEEYNVKKLMFRQFERKPLSHYRMARVREAVVLLLDNSGSMKWWAKNLQVLAELAMKRNDVEVYLAPNGVIEEMIHPRKEKVPHNDVIKKLRNRKIIYVGDFDGANTPIELSWFNDVIWICPESRYKHFMEHDWVSYSEDKFKGAFLRVFTLEQMFSAFRKLLSSPSLKIWYDLFDEYVQEDEDEDMS